MLPAEATPGKRTPAEKKKKKNATVRTVFVIGPDKKIKLMLFYPMTTGRNFDEILRALDSMQLTAKHKVATPAQWKQGQDVIIAGSVSDDEAKKLFPQGVESSEAILADYAAAEVTIGNPLRRAAGCRLRPCVWRP